MTEISDDFILMKVKKKKRKKIVKKEFSAHLAMVQKTKDKFDSLQKYTGFPSADYLLNQLMKVYIHINKVSKKDLERYKPIK